MSRCFAFRLFSCLIPHRTENLPSCPFVPCLHIYPDLEIMLDCRETTVEIAVAGSSGRNSLLPHALGVADDLVGNSLDNATGPGELGADSHEEDVDIAGC